MYVCMYVCMRMYNMYVCMFVCLFVVMVQDVVVSVGLVLFYIAFGSTAANGVGSWDDWVDYVDTVDTLIPEEVQEALDLDLIEDIRNAVTATAVSGAFTDKGWLFCLSAVAFVCLRCCYCYSGEWCFINNSFVINVCLFVCVCVCVCVCIPWTLLY